LVTEVATRVGIDLKRLGKRRPLELSGGEKRRTAIAGALLNHPELILLDEPFAGLDPWGRNELTAMLTGLKNEWGTGIALVSHSLEEVLPMADKIIVLDGGELVFDGAPEALIIEGSDIGRWGLKLPTAARFAALLRERGIEIPKEAWQIEDVVTAVKERLCVTEHIFG
jgi:energy-coupling factor transport system ATP-binding protein